MILEMGSTSIGLIELSTTNTTIAHVSLTGRRPAMAFCHCQGLNALIRLRSASRIPHDWLRLRRVRCQKENVVLGSSPTSLDTKSSKFAFEIMCNIQNMLHFMSRKSIIQHHLFVFGSWVRIKAKQCKFQFN
jgi:hypothetical protein